MMVSKSQIVARGLTNRCPNCGHHTLFPPRSFRIRKRCPECGTAFDRGEGFFLGPWVINYAVVVFVFVLPAIVLGVRQVIPWTAAMILAAFGCLVLPLFLYRRTWSWWLMIYFFFQPGFLPENGGPVGANEED
jgi:uncharacterized protein (DUF983 family)